MALDQQKRLESLAHSTALVEERLKEAELICGQVVYPAVNELRYLARNLAHILNISIGKSIEENPKLLDRYLIDAELCCQRANHDITDAIFTYISLEIDSIRKSMGASLIQGHFDNYSQHMQSLHQVNKLMSESRGSRREERVEIYDNIAHNYLPPILDFYKELLTNKNLLGEHYRSIKRAETGARFGAIFAAIASFVSILSFFGLSWSDFWPTQSDQVAPISPEVVNTTPEATSIAPDATLEAMPSTPEVAPDTSEVDPATPKSE